MLSSNVAKKLRYFGSKIKKLDEELSEYCRKVDAPLIDYDNYNDVVQARQYIKAAIGLLKGIKPLCQGCGKRECDCKKAREKWKQPKKSLSNAASVK